MPWLGQRVGHRVPVAARLGEDGQRVQVWLDDPGDGQIDRRHLSQGPPQRSGPTRAGFGQLDAPAPGELQRCANDVRRPTRTVAHELCDLLGQGGGGIVDPGPP